MRRKWPLLRNCKSSQELPALLRFAAVAHVVDVLALFIVNSASAVSVSAAMCIRVLFPVLQSQAGNEA